MLLKSYPYLNGSADCLTCKVIYPKSLALHGGGK
jgi:hypothetical protein